MYSADYFISKLNLEAHIEGGYFKELYRNKDIMNSDVLTESYDGERCLSTTIYYLLKSGQVSKFHKLKSDEIWFYHYGSPFIIHMIDFNGKLSSVKLGLDIENGEVPQLIVPANVIFGAEVSEEDSFGLVSCMVSPGFEYQDFEIYSSEQLREQYPKHKEIIRKMNG